MRGGHNSGRKISIVKQIKSILVPYFIFDTLISAYTIVMSDLHTPANLLPDALTALKGILTLNGTSVLWFLPCLFLSKLAFILFRKTKVFAYPLTAVLAIAGLLLPCLSPYLLVLWRSAVGLGFFTLGFYGANLFRKKAHPLLLCGATAVFAVAALWNGVTRMISSNYANPLLFVISSVLGSYVMIQVCGRIADAVKATNKCLRLFAWWGKNTMIILCTHSVLIDLLRLLDYKGFGNIFSAWQNGDYAAYGCLLPRLGFWEMFVLCGIVMAIECALIPLCNRFFGPLFGKFQKTEESGRKCRIDFKNKEKNPHANDV